MSQGNTYRAISPLLYSELKAFLNYKVNRDNK